MTTVFIADTGVFVRCGGRTRTSFNRFAGPSDRQVSRCDPPARLRRIRRRSRSGQVSIRDHFVSRWIRGGLDCRCRRTRLHRSTRLDSDGRRRQFIANETDRAEDSIEKVDPALVGLAAQLLDTGEADQIVLLTTDKPAGKAAETLLPQHGPASCRSAVHSDWSLSSAVLSFTPTMYASVNSCS